MYLCIFSSYLVFYGIFLLVGVLCLIGTLFVSCFELLIDLYLWVIHWYMSLFVCCLKSRSYFIYLYYFHTCGYAFCLVFQEIYRLIQLSCCLHLQLMDSSQDWICFISIIFVKGFYFVNFELLVVFCHELPKGEFVRF